MLGPKRKLGHAGAAPVDLAVEAEAPAAPTPTTAALREPIYVTEMDQHHHAAVSRTMASWVATRAGGVLVNLDSHDDLGCPPRCKLPAVATGALLASGDPAALAAFDIGTWILPLVAHGGVSSVLWVTAWGRVPACEFDAVVLLEHDGSLRVTGTAVPPVWRALWSGDYVEPPPRGPGGAGVALDLGSPQPAGLLGERLRVRFSDRFWYGGAVAGYDPKRDSYTVAFDDGDVRRNVRLAEEHARGELRVERPAGWNVGARARVLFEGGAWWGGTLGAYDPAEATHAVAFDDGDARDCDVLADAARGELRAEDPGRDYAAVRPLRVAVALAADGAAAVRRERGRQAGLAAAAAAAAAAALAAAPAGDDAPVAPAAAAAPPPPPPPPPAAAPWCLSVDLDFFSTRNPALRSLPFDGHPSFRRALWRLACAAPIEKGAALHKALDDLVFHGARPDDVIEAVLDAATGTPAEGTPTRDEAADVVACARDRFAELRGRGRAAGALAALLRAHLADHQATEGELALLVRAFEAVAAEVLLTTAAAGGAGGGRAAPEVLLARSELYTTKRQGGAIREAALGVIARIGAGR